MQLYLEKIRLNVCDGWRADELYVKVKGNPEYLFALMDDQTHFWIAQQTLNTPQTSNLYSRMQKKLQEKDQIHHTHDATNFHEAYKKNRHQ